MTEGITTIPKVLTDGQVSQYEKVELIRQQMRKIESNTEGEQKRIKARLLEKDEQLYKQNQQMIKDLKKVHPQAKQYSANFPKLKEANQKHHLKEEE